MFSRNPMKTCTKVRMVTKKKERTRTLKKMEKLLNITIPFQNLQRMRSRMPSTASKKGKKKIAVV